MLYKVPQVPFNASLLAHRYQTMAEQNALNQARRTRVFPTQRQINQTIRLKDGRTIGKGLSGLSRSARINYFRKSSPYLSGRKRGGLGNFITDAISSVTSTVQGTVSSVSNVVSGVGTSVQPIEQMLQNNPSLLNLVKTYLPGPSTVQNPTVVVAKPTVMPVATTLGVSNKIWMVGAVGAGALAFLKIMRSK
jgi:hypothetical protein